jgi:hypothetical protein
MATWKELIEAVSSRYREGSLRQRSAILDEFVAITGYHRKHAIRQCGLNAGVPVAADAARVDTCDLDALQRHGEQRPTHRRPYRRRKPLPKRPRMLDAYEP